MKKLQITFCVAVAVFAFSQIAAAQVYTSKKDEFIVWFPGKPKIENELTTDGNPMRSYSYNTNAMFLSVTVNEFEAAPTSPEMGKFILQAGRDAAVKETGAKLLSEKEITLSGHTGLELKMTKPSKLGTMLLTQRMFLIGNRLYQGVAVTFQKRPQTATVNKFINSFKYTGAPAEPAAPETSEN